MNLSLDSGNAPRSFRLFRLAEHSTPDHSFESHSRFIDIGSINGFHLHKLCRPVSEIDAKENCSITQAPGCEYRKKFIRNSVAKHSRNKKLPAGSAWESLKPRN